MPGTTLVSSGIPSKWTLRASTESVAGVQVLILAGRVSHASSPVLAGQLARLLDAGNSSLVIDFAGVDYISSAGLEVIERAAASAGGAGGALVLTGLSDPVRMAFDLAGMLSKIAAEPSRSQAIARFRGEVSQ